MSLNLSVCFLRIPQIFNNYMIWGGGKFEKNRENAQTKKGEVYMNG